MSVSRIAMCPEGPEVSRFIAGFWRLNHWNMSDQAVLTFIEQYLERGVTTVDHAMVYRSEEPFGRALKLQPALRQSLEIISKCGIRPCGFGPLGAQAVNHYDSSKAHIIASAEASLRDLGTDYLDVLLIHRPDYLMNADEVAEAFLALKKAGKVKHFGVSNFTTAQFELLQQSVKSFAPEGLVTNQIEFSPYHLEALDSGIFEQCGRHKIAPMLWSCLAGGQLLQPDTEKGKRLIQALTNVAGELGLTQLEPVIYAWVLTLPYNCLPLLGTSKIERVDSALQANELTLNREQWYRIWEASKGHAVP
ncbi:aldo/keto reductase [Teredinibacter purpureus]|uniref:aldo/keto reductase n=1 Tax=Teredinibacter purpureus TaxID=2731756 RepID=UPI0005F79ABD|nr:aldo/keto reductase [Teredinibacter purpureus]